MNNFLFNLHSHTKKVHEAKERLEAALKADSPEVKQLQETFDKLQREMEELKKKEEELKHKEKVSYINYFKKPNEVWS